MVAAMGIRSLSLRFARAMSLFLADAMAFTARLIAIRTILATARPRQGAEARKSTLGTEDILALLDRSDARRRRRGPGGEASQDA